ncbi:MAG: hypothetical protein WAU06_12105, partial [Candidatus Nanopelagicales bacterium]
MRRPLTSQARLTPATQTPSIAMGQRLRVGLVATSCATLVLAPVMAPSAQAASSVGAASAPTANCRTQVPGLKASFASQIKANSSQVVVVRGNSKRAWHNRVQYWQK